MNQILGQMQDRYLQFSAKFGNRIFCCLLNVLCLFKRTGTIFTFHETMNLFSYRDKKVGNVFFTHKSRARFYLRGGASRCQALAEQYLIHNLDFSDGDIIFDCGANIGELGVWFSKVLNKKVEYHAFEPSPDEVKAINHNCPTAVVHPFGLWKESGSLELFISSGRGDSSLIEPNIWTEKCQVSVEALKDIIVGPIKLLKLEAEGAEPEILEGAAEMISMVQYVTADVGFERGVKNESTLEPVSRFLLENGFKEISRGTNRMTILFKNTKF